MKVAINDIKLSPYQVRDLEVDPDLAALAESIKEHGQLQPIKLRPKDGEYECVFGHRRLKAAELAGWTEVEAMIADVGDKDAQIQALIENTQRKDLEAMELARALKALKDATGWSNRKIERQVGLANRVVGRTLALLEEPEDIQAIVAFDRGGRSQLGSDSPHLTPTHITEARESVADEEPRADILRKAARESLTVGQTRKLAERYRDAGTPEEKARILEVPAKKQEAVEIITEDLRRAEDRARAIKGQDAMTPADYLAKLQAAERQIDKFLIGGRQVEIWRSNAWPLIWGCFQRISEGIDEFLEEVTENAEQDNR